VRKTTSGQGQLRTLALGGITGAMLVGAIQVGLIPVQAPRPTPAQAEPTQQIRRELGTFAKLAKDLKPSVVNINVEKESRRPNPEEMFPFPFQMDPRGRTPGTEQFRPRSRGQGSGVIISSDGYILTNNHVVEGVKAARVTLADGTELTGNIVGADPNTDLALIKVSSGSPLPAAQLGDSNVLEVGDWVMAIGNPFGLEATVTVGVLSGKGRVIGAGPYDDFLQTDASINPGNSGGPLFNTAGQVVGINTAIVPNGQGIGFSIPVNMAREVVQQLKTTGKVVRGFLGVGIQPLSPRLKTALKIPAEVKGALVSSLVDGGPAGKAGVKVQDVITSVNGKPISSDRELLAEVARTPVGRKAALTIWRNGRVEKLDVPVVQRPERDVGMTEGVSPESGNSTQEQQRALGLSIQGVTPDVAAQLGVENTDGVVVVDVAVNSPAAEAGLERGDIIRKVNNVEVQSPEDFLAAVKSNDAVAFLVERRGETVFLTLGT
jgi:serine protease Do